MIRETQEELIALKMQAIRILAVDDTFCQTSDGEKRITRRKGKNEFECDSRTDFLRTSDIIEAVNWLYGECKYSSIEEAIRKARADELKRVQGHVLMSRLRSEREFDKTKDRFYEGQIEAYKDFYRRCTNELKELGDSNPG